MLVSSNTNKILTEGGEAILRGGVGRSALVGIAWALVGIALSFRSKPSAGMIEENYWNNQPPILRKTFTRSRAIVKFLRIFVFNSVARLSIDYTHEIERVG